ncbi:MAG TPA: efflux transporter outer membrane subunit [Usitatibacter sp.]|nr:efflux transporter outer membrane subunit [Usitatibacter sp.]
MRRALAFSTFAMLAACSHVALRPPEVPAPDRYTTAPVTQTAGTSVPGGQAQVFTSGADIPAQWWVLFRSPKLDALVREALDASPTLAQAEAKLRQAQEDLNARSDATTLPKVDAKLSANRVDIPAGALGGPGLPIKAPLNLYLATVSVSYTLDVFGATRNELASLRSAVDYQHYEVEAARLMLAGNVVTTAIREASLRAQLADTGEMIALQSRQLAIAERMESAGGVAHADVVSQQAELAKSRASLPDLRKALLQAHHRLAVYTGRPPGALDLPEFTLEELQLPAELPLSLPSELARQRPDIRAAEALLQEAAARVGVATANLYPQFTLSANAGSLASIASDLFKSGSGFYLLGASIAQPLFHGGELQAKRRSAVAAYDQAAAAYRETVLSGWQNVADTLRALESDADKVKERAEAATRSQDFERIASARYDAGGVSLVMVIDAQRKLRSARLDQTQAVADRYADSAALLQALGGGWWKDESASR